MSNGIPPRKYAMTKGLGSGDWLLIGNDGTTLWRFVKGEDGPSHGLDPSDFPKDFVVWQVWRWTGPKLPEMAEELSLDHDERWEFWSGDCDTREEAIDSALRSELPKPKPLPRTDSRPAGQLLADAYGIE